MGPRKGFSVNREEAEDPSSHRRSSPSLRHPPGPVENQHARKKKKRHMGELPPRIVYYFLKH